MTKQLYKIFPSSNTDEDGAEEVRDQEEMALSPEDFKKRTADVVVSLLKDGFFMRDGKDSQVSYQSLSIFGFLCW